MIYREKIHQHKTLSFLAENLSDIFGKSKADEKDGKICFCPQNCFADILLKNVKAFEHLLFPRYQPRKINTKR